MQSSRPSMKVTTPKPRPTCLASVFCPPASPQPLLSSRQKFSPPRPPGLSYSPTGRGRCADSGLEKMVRGVKEKRRTCHTTLARQVFKEASLEAPRLDRRGVAGPLCLFLAVLGLRCCVVFSLVVWSRGCSGCDVRASRCGDFSCGARAPRAPGHTCSSSCASQALEHRPSSCGAGA